MYLWKSIVWSDRKGWWSSWQSKVVSRYASERGPHPTRMRAEGGPSPPPGFSPIRVVTLPPAPTHTRQSVGCSGMQYCRVLSNARIGFMLKSGGLPIVRDGPGLSLLCSELGFKVQGSRFLGFWGSWVLGLALPFRVPGFWGSGFRVSGHAQSRAS